MRPALVALVAALMLDAHACPPMRQPELSQGLDRMIRARRAADAIDCVRQHESSAEEQSDELRYQLAQQLSNAMEQLAGLGDSRQVDRRLAARLWAGYLEQQQRPFDANRAAFATRKLTQLARYTGMEERLPAIATGIRAARARLDTELANLVFTSLRRCSAWTRPDSRWTCSVACRELTLDFIERLRQHFGEPPWPQSEGMRRLAQNAQSMEREARACVAQP